jgi:hypothetical protein
MKLDGLGLVGELNTIQINRDDGIPAMLPYISLDACRNSFLLPNALGER